MKLTNLINFLFEEEDYRGVHRAPGKTNGAPFWDVTKNVYPDDIYTLPVDKAARYYGHSQPGDKAVIRLVRDYRNNPDAEIEVYRAVPDEDVIGDINPGDWVTIYRPYAVEHGKRFDSHKILSMVVKASDLYTDGNSIYEWGWDPPIST